MSRLKDFCKERFGTMKVAAEVLGVKYITLQRNAKNPSRGWKCLDRIVSRLMDERDEAREQLNYTKEEYAHLVRKYNELVEQLEKETGGERI